MSRTIPELIQIWDKETGYSSRLMTEHPACQEICSMDEKAIPELLKNLGKSWLPIIALRAIVGKNSPQIKKEHLGKFDEINKMWRNWGKAKGFL